MSTTRILFVLQWALIGLGVASLVVWIAIASGLAPKNLSFLSAPDNQSYAPAVRRAAPGVVSIHTVNLTENESNALTSDPVFRDFFRQAEVRPAVRRETSLGSGVVLNANGLVLTNFHVVRDADAIQIMLPDGRHAPAQILGADSDTDLAVLQTALTELPVVPLADPQAVEIGDVVLAIGNPLGIGQTVTQGIVSATGRNRIGINTFENFIQTDAAINFGNSGGALVNTAGELIGINAARLDSEGIGFAIPTHVALDVARQIIQSGSVERGWMGIDARNLSPRLADILGVNQGIVILAVLADGPADRAGLKTNDVITSINNVAIDDAHIAIEQIAAIKPGTEVALQLVRNGQPVVKTVAVSTRPQTP